tara:strand:- start:2660 stop:3049 length:390 start_codon:yes stop_codon:yes gene_type:complete
MGANYSSFEAKECELLNPISLAELNLCSYKDNNRITQFKSVQQEALTLFTKKNQDYGDAFATYGPIGVLVRLGDKLSRLQSITSSKITLVDTETTRDTLIDLHNYAAMAIMLLDEENKKINNNDLDTLM